MNALTGKIRTERFALAIGCRKASNVDNPLRSATRGTEDSALPQPRSGLNCFAVRTREGHRTLPRAAPAACTGLSKLDACRRQAFQGFAFAGCSFRMILPRHGRKNMVIGDSSERATSLAQGIALWNSKRTRTKPQRGVIRYVS
ncbi:MAG: hypothetical protein LBL24_10500 [Bacteroidales bacterium]|nr:hypothetical protein [Bacteroidales bacterium]